MLCDKGQTRIENLFLPAPTRCGRHRGIVGRRYDPAAVEHVPTGVQRLVCIGLYRARVQRLEPLEGMQELYSWCGGRAGWGIRALISTRCARGFC